MIFILWKKIFEKQFITDTFFFQFYRPEFSLIRRNFKHESFLRDKMNL